MAAENVSDQRNASGTNRTQFSSQLRVEAGCITSSGTSKHPATSQPEMTRETPMLRGKRRYHGFTSARMRSITLPTLTPSASAR